MAYDASRLSTVADARSYLDNVRRLGRPDLCPDAFRRLCELEGRDDEDQLVVDFWRAIAAAEEVLRQHHGKTVRLARTRQKVKRVGVQKTVEDLASAKNASDGFTSLTEAGLADLTAEYLVLRHRSRFSDEVIASAQTRLSQAGIALPSELIE